MSQLVAQVKASNAMGHYDIHKVSEGMMLGILKELYGWKNLRDLNAEERMNFPGIDLADDERKLAVQVTATSTLDKIKSSIQTFLTHGLDERYRRVVFCVLTEKQRSYSQDSINRVSGNRISVDASNDIIDYQDLCAVAANAQPAGLVAALNVARAYMRGADAVAVAPQGLRDPFEVFTQYSAAFIQEYGREGEKWLPEFESQREELLLATREGPGCILVGPSGCGKTMMAKWLATELSKDGNVVIYLAAKDFHGTWGGSVRREVALLIEDPYETLMQASKLGRSLVIVLDGVDELGSKQALALRGIRTLVDRFDAKLVLSSQNSLATEFTELRSVAVDLPSIELKLRIARSAGAMLGAATSDIVKAVKTGLEARLIGQLGDATRADQSRVALFEQYMRLVLGGRARAALTGLRRFAVWLHEHVAFSAAEVRFDELMRSQDISFEDVDQQFSSGLLSKRAGRVSFSHELFQGVCTALANVPDTIGEAAAVGRTLSEPAYALISHDIVAAIDDSSICRAVLIEATSVGLLVAAVNGELGAIACGVGKAILADAETKCVSEIRNAELTLRKSGDVVCVEWTEESHYQWTAAERSRLMAIGQRASVGAGAATYLHLCAKMDAHLISERRRLADEVLALKFPLRSESFRLAYYGFGEQIGFTYAADAARSWIGSSSVKAADQFASFAKQSSGCLLFLLEHRRVYLERLSADQFAEELTEVIRERFRFEPYHVQLGILESVGFARDSSDELRSSLVDIIKSIADTGNWAINSSVIDALNMLGALDGDAEDSRADIREEVRSALSAEVDEACCALSLNLCLRQIDHPFDWIYFQEIEELSSDERHRLFRQALSALKADRSFGLTFIIGGVIAFEDVRDVNIVRPLTVFPDETSPFPQETWGAFVLATRFVGRHRGSLADIDTTTNAQTCLSSIRTIVYALEAGRDWCQQEVTDAWVELHALPAQIVVGCLAKTQSALMDRMWSESAKTYTPLSFIDAYPDDCLEVSRRFVQQRLDALFFGRFHGQEAALSFAFETVGRLGDRTDIGVLRDASKVPAFAEYALRAMRKLDTAV